LPLCDKRHGSLKVIAVCTPAPPERLPAEGLATIRLDYIAQKRGYGRVSFQSSAFLLFTLR